MFAQPVDADDYDPAPNLYLGVDERLWAALLLSAHVAVTGWAMAASRPLVACLAIAAAGAWVDAISYFVHDAIDNHAFRGVPVLERVAFEFQMHHRRPGDVVRRGALRNNTVELSLYLATPMAALAVFFPRGSFLGLVFLVSGIYGTLIPTLHAWSHHARHPSAIVRALQRAWLIMPPKAHLRHHVGPGCEFRSYSLVNGWTNRVLDVWFSGPPAR